MDLLDRQDQYHQGTYIWLALNHQILFRHTLHSDRPTIFLATNCNTQSLHLDFHVPDLSRCCNTYSDSIPFGFQQNPLDLQSNQHQWLEDSNHNPIHLHHHHHHYNRIPIRDPHHNLHSHQRSYPNQHQPTDPCNNLSTL